MNGQVGVAGLLCAMLAMPTLALVVDDQSNGLIQGSGDTAGQVVIDNLQVVSLDIAASPGEKFTVQVPVDGETLTLDFVPHSVRGENFQVLVQIEDGSYVKAEPSVERTLRGSVREDKGSRIAGSLLDTGLEAKIILTDGSEIWLQPASQMIEGAAAGDYVVYHQGDVVCEGYGCGTDELVVSDRVRETLGGSPRGAACGTGLCVAEMACDADVEYFNKWGSVTGVENRIESVTNTMNLEYEDDVDITHLITTIIVRTAEPDPYSSSNYITIVNNFHDHWEANHDDIQRDLAQLFTGKDLSSTVIGIAYTIAGVCTSGAYCVVQSDFSTSFSCVTDLSAHECGHLWGGNHCSCPGTTMYSVIQCANTFGTQSVTEISNHRDSRTCLGDDTPPTGPENDNCADAIAITNGFTPFDTSGASTDGPALPGTCDEGFGLDFLNDIWFNYTATCTGTAVISTCNDAVFDTRLAAYSGSGCPAGTLVGCNDDGSGCANFTSLLTIPVNNGTTYKIRLGSFDGTTGTGDLSISCTSSGGLGTLYQAYTGAATIPDGVGTVQNEDIVAFNRDTSTFSFYFDGSDVGLTSFSMDGMAFLSTGEILVSLDVDGNVTGLIGGPNGTLVDDSDIIKFTPTSLGTTTAGTWTFYFDGSDVGLTTADEDIDALTILPDGRLLVSTFGNPAVTGLTGLADEDLIAFTATSLGSVTAGTWAYYFDGSDVALTGTFEDVDVASALSTGELLISTIGTFGVTGLSGQDEDVFEFTPTSIGTVTAGTFAAFFDGSVEGVPTTTDVNAGELD